LITNVNIVYNQNLLETIVSNIDTNKPYITIHSRNKFKTNLKKTEDIKSKKIIKSIQYGKYTYMTLI